MNIPTELQDIIISQISFRKIILLSKNAANIAYITNIHTIETAAKNNEFETIKWLHHNRKEYAKHAIYYACRNGNLEIVKWLHHNRTEGCDINAMDISALNGHLDIVKWLHQNRTENCSHKALLTKYKHVKKWLLHHYDFYNNKL